jgi:hypothetical protein
MTSLELAPDGTAEFVYLAHGDTYTFKPNV